MLNRFLTIVVLIPLAIVLIALAVANRASVPFTLDPFNPGNPGLTVNLPLFIYIFAALALGVLIGSFVTWYKQGRYRKLARRRQDDIPPPQPARQGPSQPALPRSGT
ncbi:LapA family protein [Aquamicrobium sp. LC103]|uniref:LapA family protein n=1 Tax=Aquamicrobium sp. LC103 TaxID=1120658 RepID=UPI00063EC745|nr:LapA family protein [Aquamicrobium sp. LC103]TKT82634.1 LapA family protein [Aquamicrobium sp. LC103]